jgi:hypothetical protein
VRKVPVLIACGYLLTTAATLFGATPTTTTTGSTGTSAATLLSQLSTAFSGGKVVNQVQLAGSATWHVGSLNDSGSASLSAATTGSSQLQLSLSSSGVRTEAQSGQGVNLVCSWAGADGVVHTIDPGNCWRPEVWFLPPLSLQPSLLPSYLGAVDLGTTTVGFGPEQYRHLQAQLVLPDLTSALSAQVMQRSAADLGMDPATFLPAVLSYTIWPDNGAAIPIAIEIHYANYQAINGVQIPFTIQRYINGSLQLEVSLSSAQVN